MITSNKVRALILSFTATLLACSHSSDSDMPKSSTHAPNASSTSGASQPAPAANQLTPTKSTYDVVLKPGIKVIDAETVGRTFRGAGTDGTLKFDVTSPSAVTALAPGDVAIIAGTALLKVTNVDSAGGTVSVAGTPAGLEDAIESGHISWSVPFDFRKMVFTPPPGFHRVTEEKDSLLALKNLLASPAKAAFSLSSNSWNGKVKDWDVTIALTPSGGNLHVDLHANKSIAGGTVDVHGVGQLDGLTNQTSITLANGSTTEITFDNKGLKGTVDFNWKIAFDADHGGSEPKLKESDVENLPFSLDFPVPVGPIPFVVKFKTGFAFQPFISSKVALAEGSYHASFGGDVPMTDSASADSAAAASAASSPPDPAPGTGSSSMSGDGSIKSYGGTLSLAAIGLSTTVALPKISLSIGLPSALNEFLHSPDFGGPYVTLMTQANFLATGTLTMVQCEKRDLNILAVTGYKPGLLGQLKLKPKQKTVFEKTFSEIRPANITLCKN